MILPARSVTPGWCTAGQVENETVHALLGSYFHEHGGALTPPISLVGGPRLYSLRTGLVRLFLETDAEWLWSLDTDMTWDADAPFRLLAAADPVERPIIGGLCFGTGRSGGPLFPTIYTVDDGELHVRHDYQRDALVSCDATGLAFLMVHRTVFEKMAEAHAFTPAGDVDLFPWFVDGQAGPTEIEADFSFCLRARALGFPVFVHTGVHTGHKKVQIVNEELYDLVWRLQFPEAS